MDADIRTDSGDENERPTVPAIRLTRRPKPLRKYRPVGPNVRFDTPAERFFAAGQRATHAAVATAAIEADEELSEWWAAQRRAAHTWWVAALMAVCVAMLVLGAGR